MGSRAICGKIQCFDPAGFRNPNRSARSLFAVLTTPPASDKIKNDLNSVNVPTFLSDSVVFLCKV